MKLTDVMPSKADVEAFRDVEQQLETRRYTSRWSLLLAIFSAVVQIALAYRFDWPPLPKSFSLKDLEAFLASPAIILPSVAIVAACIWVVTRYTGFLFKQSKEPFRYTFSISDFAVASTPGDRFTIAQTDQLKLLRYDLTERLNRRVRRFSLLETSDQSDTAQGTKSSTTRSHFHIDGDYAIREDEREGWIVHVWPRVRIGPKGNPFTLAYPVRLPIEDNDTPAQKEKEAALDLDEYERLVERVYSSIATEIYKKIEVDLRDKMTLFPTSSLRALARYIEAEDFETSNTIDAYDRALEMYRSSLDELKASRWHLWKARRRWHWLIATQSTGIRAAMEAEAKTKLGYSRCLIYRRLVSEMAGRQRNPIFETRKHLERARELLTQCYNSFMPDAGQRLPAEPEEVQALHIALARDSVCRPLWRRQLYERIREELCETFAVSALAHSLLADSKNAQNFLQLAEALAANSTPGRVRLVLFLAKAELEPTLQQKLLYLNQAKELDLESEIVLYLISYYSDLLARDNDEITPDRVKYLNGKYEAVLKVNPANIASLIGQGYLFWLVDDLDDAGKKLRAGIELQRIVTKTFVGDLKYCLARVEVERASGELLNSNLSDEQIAEAIHRLNQAVFDFEEAMLADPSVAACYVDPQGESKNTYYAWINRQMLVRYRLFACRTRRLKTIAFKRQTQMDNDQLTNVLLSCALNDYGNACLNYYLRFDVSGCKDALLWKAVGVLEKATQLSPSNLMAEYNWFTAVTWKDDNSSAELARKLLEKSDKLPAAALVMVLAQRARALQAEIPKVNLEIERLKLEVAKQKQPEGVQREKYRSDNEKQTAVNKQSLTDNTQRLKETNDKKQSLDDELQELDKPLLKLMRKTSLAPFTEYLTPSRVSELLKNKDIVWSVFGDMEVSALVALAKIWALQSDALLKNASWQLCEHILKEYYPEHFDLIQTLAPPPDVSDERQQELNAIRDEAIQWLLRYDAKSCFYKLVRLNRCGELVSRCCQDWPYQFSKEANYREAINLYKKLEMQCADFPVLHYWLSLGYKFRAQQLDAEGLGGDELIENSGLVLLERREACRRDPNNQEYRDSLLTALGTRLIAGNTFQEGLVGRDAPKLMEVEFSSKSIPDLGFTDKGLAAELQQKINAVRDSLKENIGFILPGINFRDNAAFERGQLRFFIRGVPQQPESVSFEVPQIEQWRTLTERISEMALKNAARFYTSQDCYLKLGEITKNDGKDYSDIQNNSDSLVALTEVLKMLLREKVPITDVASIVSQFRRCRKLSLDSMRTVEEIRSLPQIRRRLPGNSIESMVIKRLKQDLESRIYEAIDWNCSEPIFNSSPKIHRQVRSLALTARADAGGDCAVLLASEEVRPFVRKIVEDIDVSVLSRREILPALLSRIKD